MKAVVVDARGSGCDPFRGIAQQSQVAIDLRPEDAHGRKVADGPLVAKGRPQPGNRAQPWRNRSDPGSDGTIEPTPTVPDRDHPRVAAALEGPAR